MDGERDPRGAATADDAPAFAVSTIPPDTMLIGPDFLINCFGGIGINGGTPGGNACLGGIGPEPTCIEAFDFDWPFGTEGGPALWLMTSRG